MPAEPIIFFKATSSICGPDDDLVLPRHAVASLRNIIRWFTPLIRVIGRSSRVGVDAEFDLALLSQQHTSGS